MAKQPPFFQFTHQHPSPKSSLTTHCSKTKYQAPQHYPESSLSNSLVHHRPRPPSSHHFTLSPHQRQQIENQTPQISNTKDPKQKGNQKRSWWWSIFGRFPTVDGVVSMKGSTYPESTQIDKREPRALFVQFRRSSRKNKPVSRERTPRGFGWWPYMARTVTGATDRDLLGSVLDLLR
ncbi:hypothetical protein GQ457_10G005730 [Hibiscus cannabinus]